MKRLTVALGAAMLIALVPGQRATNAQGDTVNLDVVVVDKDGKPITDLKPEEFQVEDDGKKVELKSVTPMSVTSGRTVIVVLDDSSVGGQGTQVIQNIADIFMSSAAPADKVSLVRLHGNDEAIFDRQAAATRVMSYQSGSVPFNQEQTPEEMLLLTKKLAEQLQQPAGRKAILCIGGPVICNIEARASSAPREMYPNWVNAMSALAHSNVGFYAMIPINQNIMKGGITDVSGGAAFNATRDFAISSSALWQQLGQYYMVSYTPAVSSKDLRKLAVKVSRKGAIVQSRTVRGK